MRDKKIVSVEEQGQLSKIVKRFEKEKLNKLTSQPNDLNYLLKLLDRYKTLQDTSGHMKLFPPNTPVCIERYPKHECFFKATAMYRQILFQAGNQIGKSTAGATCISSWATGRYLPFWQGRRFDYAPKIWVVGDSKEVIRDNLQVKLLGEKSAIGTGTIPGDLIEDIIYKPNSGGSVDTILVRHEPTGKISRIGMKSYEQGPKAFYGTVMDVIWLDEEPTNKDAQFIYSECLMRTFNTGGLLIITFTPLHGPTPIVMAFKEDADHIETMDDFPVKPKSKAVVQAGWIHAGHITTEMIEEFKKETPPHLLDARMNGDPTMGDGNVYQVPKSQFVIDPIPIQPDWEHLAGLDVGFKVTGAVFGAYDRHRDIIYIYGEYRGVDQNVVTNAHGIKNWTGTWMPILIDPASQQRSQFDGNKLITEYRRFDLDVRPATNAVEAGIHAVYKRLLEGKLKIFNTCSGVLKEYETYRRKDGKIVKEFDHQLDALRYLVMDLPHAKVKKVSSSNYTYKNPYKF